MKKTILFSLTMALVSTGLLLPLIRTQMKAAMESKEAAAMPSVGEKAPDFKLMDDTGRDVSLSDFKGKYAVLYFYPKDDTPGCTKEACQFRDESKTFNKKNVVILGVSADSIESHQKFKTKYGLPFKLLSDPDRKVLNEYGVWVRKTNYGKTYMGIERTTFVIGPDGKIAKVFPKVKVDGHIEEVLNSIPD